VKGEFRMSWFLRAFRKYAVFEGRARRKEYWYFQLFKYIIILAPLLILSFLGILTEDYSEFLLLIGLVYYLLMFLPTLAVTIRRLHDTGRSGWWYLITFIPYLGGIILLILLLGDSQPGENEYGPNPKKIENKFEGS
jgi:uncharacterized membrane protein YhaH (DUF805 family)